MIYSGEWMGCLMTMTTKQVKRVFESVSELFIHRFGRRRLPATAGYSAPIPETETLSTGFRSVDNALGTGGLPYSRIIELMGPGGPTSQSGASYIAAGIASRIQRKQENVTIIDMGPYFDVWQAERCGLIAPHLLLSRPETVFDALTILEDRHQRPGLIIVVMGSTPELFGQAPPELRRILLGRLRHIVKQSGSIFLFLTAAQKNDPFSPVNHPAGFPLSELADVRLWIQEESASHKNGLIAAYKATLAVIKNNLAPAGKGADIRIKFNDFDRSPGYQALKRDRP
jgi:recombination protein RecA